MFKNKIKDSIYRKIITSCANQVVSLRNADARNEIANFVNLNFEIINSISYLIISNIPTCKLSVYAEDCKTSLLILSRNKGTIFIGAALYPKTFTVFSPSVKNQ